MAVDPERLALNRTCLSKSRLDALICYSPTQVLLLSGYWPIMGASLALFPAEGEITLIVPEDEYELAGKTTSAKIVSYNPSSLNHLSNPLTALAKPLKLKLQELGLTHARIGLQFHQTVQPASYAVMNEFRFSLLSLLQELLPNAALSSSDDLLDRMEAKKTTIELQILQKACDVAASGFAEAKICIVPGKHEAEIAAAAQAAFATTKEADSFHRSYGYFYCMSGPNSAKAAAAYARTRRRVVEQGDLVMVHANTCADGYWTDLTRTYTAGTSSKKQLHMREAIEQAHAAALQAIRPGVTGRDVDGAARSVMQSHGYGAAFKHAAGHGVGFAAANPRALPRIHPLSEDLLEEGMTFNLEPAAYFEEYGGMRHCDVIAVTANGARVISRF